MPVVREKVVQQAEKYVSRGKIEAGIREYRKLLADQPNDISTLNRVGDLYTRIDRNAEAIKLFEQIAERYSEDGFFVKAIAIYKKIIKIDPTRLGIYERLAELYHRQGLVNEARTQYQVLADYYQKHEDRDGAIGIYRRMVELEPDNPGHRARLADVYRQAGRIDDAMAEYRAIAETMVDHGEAEQAYQVYERALEVSADDLGFVTDGVLKLKAAGEPGAAARFLAAAVAKNPDARRVARLAGLESRPPVQKPAKPAPSPATPPVPPEPPTRPAQPPVGATDATAADGEETAFELDLDEPSSSQVTPPADMLADAGRPGAAWSGSAAGLPAAAAPAEPAAPTPAGPGAAPPLGGDELEDSFVFDLDEDLLAGEPAAGGEAEAAAGSELDHDLLERTADEVVPARRLAADDLLTEAEVLAKYGIADKAIERLSELLEREPDHLEGLALIGDLQLDKGDLAGVAGTAGRLARAAAAAGRDEVWEPLRRRLEGAGWSVAGDRVSPPGAAAPPTETERPPVPAPPAAGPGRIGDDDEEVRLVLPDFDEEDAPATAEEAPPAPAVPDEPAAAEASDLEVIEEALEGLADPEPPARTAPPAAAPPSEPEADPLRALGDSLRDELGADAPLAEPPPAAAAGSAPAEPKPPARPSSPPPSPTLDDSVSWLDELTAARPEGEELAGEAAGFFDLGAELEQELTGEGLGDELFGADQSIEEIVEGFRKGVAETLSSEDFDTHFNLGIAFREMGLLDEAIGEFQLAAKDPGHLVAAASMLGMCFLQKGMPELAVKWYRRGLEAPQPDEERLGLLYDLGNACLAAGEPAEARKVFVEIYGIDSSYRDVVAKLAELET